MKVLLSKGGELGYTHLVTDPYSNFYFRKSVREEVGTFDVKERKAVLLGDGNGNVGFTTVAE